LRLVDGCSCNAEVGPSASTIATIGHLENRQLIHRNLAPLATRRPGFEIQHGSLKSKSRSRCATGFHFYVQLQPRIQRPAGADIAPFSYRDQPGSTDRVGQA
jgi:hypothetical protein